MRLHGRVTVEAVDKRMITLSKRLAKCLRHAPEQFGVTLGTGGWTEVEPLLHALRMTRAELEHVVAHNDKSRFALDGTGTLIRASQGHSVQVDLDLPEAQPPAVLYHGTAERTVPAILAEGLRPMRRHDVHLSRDVATARRVGARHGRPVVFEVDAAGMSAAGHVFRVSANGVWLTGSVPANALRLMP
ncbi:hypothetical protein KALB_7059 [Kutzneria albida DSM 43870]|uniref:Probable RNA 2'-phosphotransferase n=2 Tax=Kutzneria TaxID=43356 RepID=W5WIJ5_9PSEU|nr:hypothetical protein KALB_7059 [Kutzneria albida DSM 43870]